MTDVPEPIAFTRRVPDGDNRLRAVCDRCGFIHYENPVVVVGVVCIWEGRVLLCRRAIEPREGYWTIPAGYLEQHETPESGARRETEEEACADVAIDALLGVYAIPPISQVQLIYRGSLRDGRYAPGVESHEVRLFAWDEIPWGELAFPSVHWALTDYRKTKDDAAFVPFVSPFQLGGTDPEARTERKP